MAKRTLEVKVRADGKQLKKGLDESQKHVGSFEKTVKKAGMALVGAFAARAVFNGLKNLVVNLGNAADRLLDLEQITAINVETLQEYEYVAKIAGVSTEALANASMGLTQRLARATGEASPLNIALGQLGISAKTATGELRNGGDIMEDVIQQLADMENITERNVLGSQIFAGAWKDMAPILSMGADGIEKVRKEAREMGIVMDRDALEKANALRVSLERLQGQSKALSQELGLALIPTLTTLAEKTFDVVKSTKSFFDDVLTASNMSKLEKYSRLAGGAIVGILTGGRAGRGIVQPVYDASYEAQARAEIEKTGLSLEHYQDAVVALQKEQDELASRTRLSVEEQKRLYITIPQTIEHAQTQITKIREKAAAEEAAAAEAARKEAEAIERERIKAEQERVKMLGNIGRLEEDIARARAEFIAANSEADRVYALERLDALEQEKKLLEEIARATITAGQTDFIDMGVADEWGVGLFDGVNEDIERTIANMDKVDTKVEEIKEAMIDWSQVAAGAAATVGMGFMQMAQDSSKSVSDIIKQLLSQVTAQLIASIMSNPAIVFPANIALAAGAGAMAGGLFNHIPAFADGAKVTQPTLAMFGEYPGASSNPEYALREDQLRKVVGGGGGKLEARFSRDEMIVWLNEGERRQKNSF